MLKDLGLIFVGLVGILTLVLLAFDELAKLDPTHLQHLLIHLP